jgi:hypothetical protein
VWLYSWPDINEVWLDTIVEAFEEELLLFAQQLDRELTSSEQSSDWHGQACLSNLPDYWLTIWDNRTAAISRRENAIDLTTGEDLPKDYNPKPLYSVAICLTKLFLIGRAGLFREQTKQKLE